MHLDGKLEDKAFKLGDEVKIIEDDNISYGVIYGKKKNGCYPIGLHSNVEKRGSVVYINANFIFSQNKKSIQNNDIPEIPCSPNTYYRKTLSQAGVNEEKIDIVLQKLKYEDFTTNFVNVSSATVKKRMTPRGNGSKSKMFDRNLKSDFLEMALLSTDSMLNALGHIEDDHPFATMLLHGVLFVRDILCCWENQYLHSIAIETLRSRLYIMEEKIEKEAINLPMEVRGNLWEKINHDWVKLEHVHTRTHYLYYVRKNQLEKIDLREIKEVLLEEFSAFRVITSTRSYQFRSRYESQKWVTFLNSFMEQNEVCNIIKSLPSSEVAQIYKTEIYQDNYKAMNAQFLFSEKYQTQLSRYNQNKKGQFESFKVKRNKLHADIPKRKKNFKICYK